MGGFYGRSSPAYNGRLLLPYFITLALPSAQLDLPSIEKTLAAAFSSLRKEAAPVSAESKAVSMTEAELDAAAGVYRNRWPVALVREDGRLVLEQFGGRLPVTRRGLDAFEAQAPGGGRPIPFRLIPGADGKGELLQMFLWVFKKEQVAP